MYLDDTRILIESLIVLRVRAYFVMYFNSNPGYECRAVAFRRDYETR